MKPMSKWERIEAAVQGEPVDHIPFCFWRHYSVQEWSPKRLAELTLALYRKFDLDMIKLAPILTPTCTINARSPEANLRAARQASQEVQVT